MWPNPKFASGVGDIIITLCQMIFCIFHVSVGKQEMPDEVMAIVYNSGDVLHIPATTLVSMCSMDLRKFPFDEQTCTLKFGSWTYDGFKVNRIVLNGYS